MEPFGTYAVINPQSDRVLQLIIAMGPFILLLLMRMVIGRSKTLMLAVWLSVGWLALRIQSNTSTSFLHDFARPIERLLEG
jgi:hypothetical protein